MTILLQLPTTARKKAVKIQVSLNNSAGEVASDSFDVPADCHDPDEIVNLCATDIIQGWILSAGDTITIRQVPASA
jgi:hypothetical protein